LSRIPQPQGEYEEALWKARFAILSLRLIETFGWDGHGIPAAWPAIWQAHEGQRQKRLDFPCDDQMLLRAILAGRFRQP
jgi:hypothetical protein